MNYLLLLMSILISFQLVAQPKEKPVQVEVAKAIEKELAPGIWLPGTVISREDARLSAEVDGALTQIVEVGTRVAKGDVLAAVNDRTLRLRLQRDKADLERLKVQLKYAEVQLERAISLSKSNSASQSRIDELAQQRDVLKHEVAIAEIAVDQSAYQLERAKILASFDGVVVERFRQRGEYVTESQALLRLVNTHILEVTVRAPVSVARYVHPNEVVPIKFAEQMFETSVRSVIPVGDTKTRMLEVRLNLQPSAEMASTVVGDAVSVFLSNGQKRMETVVPRDALIFRPNRVFVFRVNGEQVAEKVPVKLGSGDRASIAVMGALKPGDKVVIRGGERLTDGKKVELAKKAS